MAKYHLFTRRSLLYVLLLLHHTFDLSVGNTRLAFQSKEIYKNDPTQTSPASTSDGNVEIFNTDLRNVINLDRKEDTESIQIQNNFPALNTESKNLKSKIKDVNQYLVANSLPDEFQKVFTNKKIVNKKVAECADKSSRLLGPIRILQENLPDLNEQSSSTFSKWFGKEIAKGGAYKPSNCIPKQKIAIIVSYRDRYEHLKVFLHHLHPVLQRQERNYRIFVIEQSKEEEFNRGSIMNIGYLEALKYDNFDCFVFHDVDLLPEDDRNLYECPDGYVKHLSVAVNKWKYRLQYYNYFGGVSALSKDQFSQMNGYANTFYGWGGEDDDLHHRIQMQNYTIFRSPATIARFYMQVHDPSVKNTNLETLMHKSAKDELRDDGLSSIKYTKLDEKELPLYTWILVRLPRGPTKPPKNWLKEIGNGFMGSVSTFGSLMKAKSFFVNSVANLDVFAEKEKSEIY